VAIANDGTIVAIATVGTNEDIFSVRIVHGTFVWTRLYSKTAFASPHYAVGGSINASDAISFTISFTGTNAVGIVASRGTGGHYVDRQLPIVSGGEFVATNGGPIDRDGRVAGFEVGPGTTFTPEIFPSSGSPIMLAAPGPIVSGIADGRGIAGLQRVTVIGYTSGSQPCYWSSHGTGSSLSFSGPTALPLLSVYAQAITTDIATSGGPITGYALAPGKPAQALLWTHGLVTNLTPLIHGTGTSITTANGINAKGEIIAEVGSVGYLLKPKA